MKVIKSMLTTFDNPFNPFEKFEDWLRYDQDHGYDCNGKLSRMHDYLEIDDNDWNYDLYNAEAIDRIVKNDLTNTFIKVTKEFEEK